MSEPLHHLPVLADETLALLDPRPGEVWVDATTGAAGHAARILAAIGPTGTLVAIDQDEGTLAVAQSRLVGGNVRAFAANFDQLPAVLERAGLERVDGVLADLGISSDQLDDPARGLSFRHDGPLDMRLSRDTTMSAADLLARLDEAELATIFWEFGEERHSRRIARRVVERRQSAPIRTTAEFADLVRSCVPRERRARGAGLDPATRAFQGLRIAVNDELGALDRLLRVLPDVVRPGGRVGVISFHSLEDRRVKHAFREGAAWDEVTRKPVQASEDEVRRNPRARSAKLRVARRNDAG